MAELRPSPGGYPIKLVRDKTPEILNFSGHPGDLWYGPASRHEIHERLGLKLAEEVAEFLIFGGDDELADVYAVVMGAAAARGIDLPAMLEADPRGGYFDGVMMYGRHDEFDLSLSSSAVSREQDGQTR